MKPKPKAPPQALPWPIRPGEPLASIIREHCTKNGIKINFFVTQAMREAAIKKKLIK